MTRTFSGDGIYIAERDFQQILLRGKGDGRFAETVNGEISLLPPKDNLRMISNENFLFAKQSFDQWSLILTEKKETIKIDNTDVVSCLDTFTPFEQDVLIRHLD